LPAPDALSVPSQRTNQHRRPVLFCGAPAWRITRRSCSPAGWGAEPGGQGVA